METDYIVVKRTESGYVAVCGPQVIAAVDVLPDGTLGTFSPDSTLGGKIAIRTDHGMYLYHRRKRRPLSPAARDRAESAAENAHRRRHRD